MEEHPIKSLMNIAMENIKGMVDVHTIVGKPVETVDGYVIIPVSRVSFGFAAGGAKYNAQKVNENGKTIPFAGGSGAGITLSPVAFLIVGGGQVRLLTVKDNNALDKLINSAPELLQQLQNTISQVTNKKPTQ